MTKFISATAIAAATSMLTALAAAVSVPTAANAQEVNSGGNGNHYEWRLPPQYGPRAPLRPAVRVLVDANGKPVIEQRIAKAVGPNDGPGHYEWRAQPSYGPRAPLRASLRVWVPDAQMAAVSTEKLQN